MSYKFSRRELANYAIAELQAGHSARVLAKQLAAALLASGRAKEVDLLVEDIWSELESRGLATYLTITTANKLSAELKTSLTKYVKSASNVDKMVAAVKIDPAVIAGFKLETANRSWDKTARRQLSVIKGGI